MPKSRKPVRLKGVYDEPMMFFWYVHAEGQHFSFSAITTELTEARCLAVQAAVEAYDRLEMAPEQLRAALNTVLGEPPGHVGQAVGQRFADMIPL